MAVAIQSKERLCHAENTIFLLSFFSCFCVEGLKAPRAKANVQRGKHSHRHSIIQIKSFERDYSMKRLFARAEVWVGVVC